MYNNNSGLNSYGNGSPGGMGQRSISSSSLSSMGNGSSVGISRPVGSLDKVEEGLAIHIKKALSPEETAPKQKHVRACIVYTWDTKSSASFWMGLKLTPILGDEIMCWKALVTLHKVVRDGHPTTLKDSQQETAFIESIARSVQHQMGSRIAGYGVLIRAYVQYILSKLQFHKLNPEFNANFQYEEYISLKGTVDPNEGFEKVMDLLHLLDQLDSMQKLIFANFRGASNNECRISALVPLVEESYGIYCFLKSMLTAMHQRVASAEPLEPLVEKFNAAHHALRQFYFECSGLKYLTSLIQIPKLPAEPPTFVPGGQQVVARKKSPPPQVETPPSQEADLLNLQVQEHQLVLEQQQQQMRLRFEEEQRRLEQEKMRMMMEQRMSAQQNQQLQWGAMQRVAELERELLELREKASRDKELMDAYDRRMKALEQQLHSVNSTKSAAEDAKDDLIRRLKVEVAQWKSKYQSIVNLYSQLRKEHLELLNKMKEIKDGEASARNAVKAQLDKLQEDLRLRNAETADALLEKQRLENELKRLQMSHEQQLNDAKNELNNCRQELLTLGSAKGAEVESLIARFNEEKGALETKDRSKQQLVEDLQRQLDKLQNELVKLQSHSKEEAAVLQAGMDQSLMALTSLQATARDTESSLLLQLDKITAENAERLSKILDAVFDACIKVVNDASFDLDTPLVESLLPMATAPELALSVVERAVASSEEFKLALIAMAEGGNFTEAIQNAHQFAQTVSSVLVQVKLVSKLARDDSIYDKVILLAKRTANDGVVNFFQKVKAAPLQDQKPDARPGYITDLSDICKDYFAQLSSVIEELVVRDKAMLNAKEDEIVDVVEREMMAAARAIEEAVTRLSSITSKPSATATELNVHRAILEAALAMTNAVGNLIKYATLAQQEIVAHGADGSTTKGAFYKQNNRWTEGLISAAKAVAIAVNMLVESADGVVRGTHSMEQLVVAATEVSAATTQLVAASRVKAVPGSRTQGKLETASVAVREAVKLLVKAAKDASKRNAEERVLQDLKTLSPHEYKVQEMEQQVRILELEKNLSIARQKLSEMRRQGYQSNDETGLDGQLSNLKF